MHSAAQPPILRRGRIESFLVIAVLFAQCFATPAMAMQPWAIAAHRQAASIRPSRSSVQTAPPVIPPLDVTLDAQGFLASYQPGGATITSKNAFFANLGSNGRTCITCHQPNDGWTIAPPDVKLRFFLSAGTI